MTAYDKLLILLLTDAICGNGTTPTPPPSMTDEEIEAITRLSQKHDLTHLIGVALESASPEDKNRYKPFFTASIKAMYRYEWLKGEQNKIYALLEQYNIPYIPLKGAVIRDLYREPWHRTSCDIDILIPEERLEEAVSAFEKDLSYSKGKRSLHDVPLTAPNGVHFELHFDIDETYVDRTEFWDDAKPLTQGSCRYTMSAEMVILTHIAHMAKHFANGGCGLRPFLDLWLMKEKLTYDRTKLAQMLDSHGLTEFHKAVVGLVDVWFDGKTPNETEMMVQEFLMPAGAYGDLDNRVSVVRSKEKGGALYVIYRIFPPLSILKTVYPVLAKHPCLLPVCWVRRWIRLICTGKLKKVKMEYDIYHRLDEDEVNKTKDLIQRLQLKML